jgi:KipI family sensor histidine kinase inhibitor
MLVSNVIRDYGDRALLVECASTDEVLALTSALNEAKIPGVLAIVPASRTILLELAGPRDQAPTRQVLARLQVNAAGMGANDDGYIDVVIDVVYNGADLADVADLTGLDIPGVIEAHTARQWRCGFGGFAPGFAYLVGGDPRLSVPRRSEPRTKVPAGSVGLAGEFSGVYPRQSPGGWQLIGHTDAVLWDVNRPQPALLMPGMRVQFRAV